jgi:hypothetical protein
MDAQEQLAWDAEFAVGILLNGTDVELINLSGPPLTPDTSWSLAHRGLSFVGAMGLLNGQPCLRLEAALTREQERLITQAFLLRMESEINARLAPQRDGFADYMTTLWALKDTRAN